MNEHTLTRHDHRPWPLPSGPWVMYQQWSDLLFMHWPVPRDELRRLIPSPLVLDTFDNQAWLGVVPFEVSDLRLRGFPSLPWLSRFCELNVRTYVHVNDKPGVYFFSLDAGRLWAVLGARAWYHLPYFHARITRGRSGQTITYNCMRIDPRARAARFVGRYEPIGAVTPAKDGSLDQWLTERYCLYAAAGDRIYEAEIHHPPWPLQPAAAAVETNTMASSHGIRLPDIEPLLHFARTLDVLVWPPKRVLV